MVDNVVDMDNGTGPQTKCFFWISNPLFFFKCFIFCVLSISLRFMLQFQDSIFRTFQETESLLEHLRVGTEPNEPSSPGATGAKMPKDDKIIIEELQTANNHLRKMVETMFAELETYKKENSELKARIRDLEAEKKSRSAVAGHVEYPGLVTHVTKLDLGLEDSGQFPDLAPLEMPQFDFPTDNKS